MKKLLVVKMDEKTAIQVLLKFLDAEFNKPCKEIELECSNCKAEFARASLRWLRDTILNPHQ